MKIKLIFNGNGVIIMRVLRLCSQMKKPSKISNFKSSAEAIKLDRLRKLEMDKSDMSRAEKKELRNEVKEIRQT
jgi:hypothetical protein